MTDRQAPIVATARCTTYDPPAVDRALGELVARGEDPFAMVRRGDRVLVKLNHLGEHPPERAVITHPEVLGAVLAQLADRGARLVVGDVLDRAGAEPFETSGTRAACARFGVEPVNLRTGGFAHRDAPGGVKLPRPLLSRAVAEADLVVNVPKLKAHVQTTLTLGLKNTYGLLPHRVRTQLHRELLAVRDFTEMLVDVWSATGVSLTVLDGVIGLEGEGPGRKGTPRPVGVLLCSRDAVALDAVATAIVGLPPRQIGTTRIAADRGLGEARLAAIEIRGPSVAELRVPGFRLPSRMLFAATIFDRLPPLLVEPATGLATLGRERPELVTDRCTGCGECVTACPEGGLRLRNGVVELDPKRCTPCFACVEACPTEALERGWNRAGQVTHGLTTVVNRTRRRVKRFLGLRR